MLRNLCVAASVFSLMGSMPAFASAMVDAGHVPNEVIPWKHGTECPQLDFGHRIIEKVLSELRTSDDFTASINSKIWTVHTQNMGALLDGHFQRDKTIKGISLLAPKHVGQCLYHVQRNGGFVALEMEIKLSDEARKKNHLKEVIDFVRKIKDLGVVSRADFLKIINQIMP